MDLYWIEDEIYYNMEMFPSNLKKEITRTYFTLIDAFSSVGGLMYNMWIFVVVAYCQYNAYAMTRDLLEKVIIGKEAIYDPELRVKKQYMS